MTEAEEKTEAVRLLYGVAVADIREFKARQWEVTKWAVTVTLALIIPLLIGDNVVPSYSAYILLGIGFLLSIWASGVILGLQRSLRTARLNLDRYKDDWKPLKSVYGTPKEGHTSFFKDWYIWMFQIALITAAMVVLLMATLF